MLIYMLYLPRQSSSNTTVGSGRFSEFAAREESIISNHLIAPSFCLPARQSLSRPRRPAYRECTKSVSAVSRVDDVRDASQAPTSTTRAQNSNIYLRASVRLRFT